MRISAHGLSVDAPTGWDARIRKLSPPAPAVGHRSLTPAGETLDAQGPFTYYPVLHAADFALPERRGDFGSGAVEIMGPNQAFIALIEYQPQSAGTALFSQAGMPRQVSADAFSPQQLQRTLRGQAGWQRFFVEKGRAFCLYVVLGGFAQRAAVVPRLNATLARIEVGAA